MKKTILSMLILSSLFSCQKDKPAQEYKTEVSSSSPFETDNSYSCEGSNCLDSIVLIQSGEKFCEGLVISDSTVIAPSNCLSSCKNTSGQDLNGKTGKCVQLDKFYTSEAGKQYSAISFDKKLGTTASTREVSRTDLMLQNTTIIKNQSGYVQQVIGCELTFKSLFHPKAASEAFEELNLKACDSHGVIHQDKNVLALISHRENKISIATNQSCLTGNGECKKSDAVRDETLFIISKINKNIKEISEKKAQVINALMMKSSDSEYVEMFLPLIDISEKSITITDRVNCFSKKPNFWINNKSTIDISLNEFGEIIEVGKGMQTKELYLFEAIENHYNPFNGQSVKTVIVPSNVKENILNQTPSFVDLNKDERMKIKANFVTNTPNIFVRDGKFQSIIGPKDLGKYNNLSIRSFETCSL